MASDKALIKRCKTHFGTTKNELDAGFILPDGSMLDFKRSNPVQKEVIPHGFIARCMPEYEEIDYFDAMKKFMKDTGALRVDISPRKRTYIASEAYTYFEGVANVKPTSDQARILGKRCRERECEWSIRTPESTNCEWSKQPTSWSEYMRAFERCKQK